MERAVELARAEGSAARIRDTLGELAEAMAAAGDTQRAFELMREALRAS